jgi:hypothetical protein
MLDLDRPRRIQLSDDLCLHVLVIAENEIFLDVGTRAVGMESGSVLACDTGNIEVIDAAAGGAARAEVGYVPDQGRANTEAVERKSRDQAEDREGDREDRRELHDRQKVDVSIVCVWRNTSMRVCKSSGPEAEVRRVEDVLKSGLRVSIVGMDSSSGCRCRVKTDHHLRGSPVLIEAPAP